MSIFNLLKKLEQGVLGHPQQPQQPQAPQGHGGILAAVQPHAQYAQYMNPDGSGGGFGPHNPSQLRVGESYMNSNPRMNARVVAPQSYLNVHPGMAQPGTIQPIQSRLQAGYSQPQLPSFGQRTGQLQVQPSYLNYQ